MDLKKLQGVVDRALGEAATFQKAFQSALEVSGMTLHEFQEALNETFKNHKNLLHLSDDQTFELAKRVPGLKNYPEIMNRIPQAKQKDLHASVMARYPALARVLSPS